MKPETQALYDAAKKVLADAAEAGLYRQTGKHTWEPVPGIDPAKACAIWNEQVRLRKMADASFLVEQHEKGHEYWRNRGIKVGATVSCLARDTMTGGLLSCRRVYGTAKVGKCGAYVSCKEEPGRKLDPDAFSLPEVVAKVAPEVAEFLDPKGSLQKAGLMEVSA